MLLPLPRARPPSADQRRRHPAHHPRCLQLHDWHGEETRLRDHWQRVYKLILAKEDVLTVSRVSWPYSWMRSWKRIKDKYGVAVSFRIIGDENYYCNELENG